MSDIAKVCVSAGTSEVVTATTEQLAEIAAMQLSADEQALLHLRAELAITDAYMARMCEDLIDILVDKGTIALTDFSQAAQDKLTERAQIRTDIAALEE